MSHDPTFPHTPWRLPRIAAVVAAALFTAGIIGWMWQRNSGPRYVPPSGGAAAINRALEDCLLHGGEVRLGSGVYDCDRPVIIHGSNITLRGAGAATLLKLKPKANCPVLIMGDEAQTPRHETFNVCIADLQIDGNRAQQEGECWSETLDGGLMAHIRSSGIVLRGVVNGRVENVVVADCSSAGIVTEKGCRRLHLQGIDCSDNAFDGIACYETEESILTGLFMHDNRAAGISADIRFNRNIIANAVLARNGSHGIFMRNSHKNLFQGIMIRDSGKHGVFLEQVDKDPATGASGNSFIGITVEGSKGPAMHFNPESCNSTIVIGSQFFENEKEFSEALPSTKAKQADSAGGHAPTEANPAIR